MRVPVYFRPGPLLTRQQAGSDDIDDCLLCCKSEGIRANVSPGINLSFLKSLWFPPVLWIRKLFFRIRIHKIFLRIRIRILQTYILGQTIPKFSFNGLRTFSEYNTTKKNFLNCENMCVFSFNSSICHAQLLNYSVWIRIRIRIRIFFRIRIRQKVSDSFGFGFGSATLVPTALIRMF
jgi:hypothetical protein